MKTMYWAYLLLASVRIFLVFLPQTGYIHPDEFFQGPEVIAGNVFGLQVQKTWEFQTSQPIRCIAFPALTSGLPFVLLKLLAGIFRDKLNTDLLSPYWLLIAPRIFMTLLSFIVDLMVFKIARLWKINASACLLWLSSSYVMVVYATRTFSNSMETILFALLLFYVCDAMERTEQVHAQEKSLEEERKMAHTAADRVRLLRKHRKLMPHNYFRCHEIAIITTLGFFNRSTFIIYSFAPIFFWLQRGMSTRQIGFTDFHLRMFSLFPSTVLTSMVLVFLDSLYYGTLSWREITGFNFTASDFVITPVNFIVYNLDRSNLEEHGLHPWYLHVLVNVPILFGVLGLLGLISTLLLVIKAVSDAWVDKPKLFHYEGLMHFAFAIPVLILSLNPHKEARFLLPGIIPLVLLFGPTWGAHQKGWAGRIVRSSWYAWNVMGIVLFGFVHQGGIHGVLDHFRQHLATVAPLTHTHIVASHTYMVPNYLLMLPDPSRTLISAEGVKYKKAPTTFMHDMKGEPIYHVKRYLAQLLKEEKEQSETKKIRTDVFLVLPLTWEGTFRKSLLHKNPGFELRTMKHVYPHLSMEDPPNFSDLCTTTGKLTKTQKCQKLGTWLESKASQLALAIYQVIPTLT